MKLKSLLLASALFASPAMANHDHHDMTADNMASMGHHVATPFEIAANKQIEALVAQATARPAGPGKAAIWADIRDASKAKYANDPVAFDRFINAAKAKLATSPATSAAIPNAGLFRAYGRYTELRKQSALALEPRIFPGKTVRKYNETTATKAAIAVVGKASTATPAQIAQATAAFAKASATLEYLIKRPTL